MSATSDAIGNLLARALLSPDAVGMDAFEAVPEKALDSLSTLHRLAWDRIKGDVAENGTADSTRIAASANGDGGSLVRCLTELMDRDVPADPADIVLSILAAMKEPGSNLLCLETLNPKTAADLISCDMPDPEPLITGLLYPETVLVIGGLVKARKTWLALQLALSGISAVDFLGHAIRRKLRVLYVGGEGNDRSIRKRLMLAVGFIPGVEDEDMNNLGIVSSQGRVKLDTQAGEDWLQRVSEGYDVVVVDPFYRFLSVGSENDHADQRTIQDVFDRLKAKGKAVVLVHHLRKPQGVDAGAAELRGAGLDAFADSILLLARKRQRGEERFTIKYVLRHDEEPDDLELTPNGPLLKVAEPLPSKATPQDLVDALNQAGGILSGTDLKQAVKATTQAAKHEIDDAITEGVSGNVIRWKPKPGRGQGRLYFLP